MFNVEKVENSEEYKERDADHPTFCHTVQTIMPLQIFNPLALCLEFSVLFYFFFFYTCHISNNLGTVTQLPDVCSVMTDMAKWPDCSPMAVKNVVDFLNYYQ